MSSNGGNNRNFDDGMVCDDDVSKQMERNRAVDSPLGHLDPSRITHMVVDQVFPGGSAVHSDSDGFVVPDPPHQPWPRSSPVASPSVMSSPSRAMDGGQSRMGTPTNLMHMQQGAIGSPAICSAPMTPQQMVQQQQSGMIQGQPTPTGQFDQSGGFNPQQQQMPQGYSQVVPESPSAVHMQQQMVAAGVAGQGDGSPGMYARQQQQMMGQQQTMNQQQMQQQQMLGQQQSMMGHQMMVSQQMGMMSGNPQQYYQQNPQAQWTQQQQQMQQAHFARQPQMLGATSAQRVMVQRVPYPPGTGYPPGMQGVAQQQQQPQGVAAQSGGRPPGAPPQQAQRPTYPPGATAQAPPQYAYSGGQPAGYPQPQTATQAAAYQQQMYQRQQQVPQHQQMRPYMSPQGAMVTPTHQGG
ncbi:hypothetical protein GCK32_013376, partial [Trichostrongylus colubriformis]